MHASAQQWETFAHICEFKHIKPLKMRYDVPTRWNSAYFMLKRACYLRKAIDQYVLDDEDPGCRLKKYKLSKAEWEHVEMLTTLLLPFKNTSVVLQKTSRPRIDYVFWSYEILFNNIDDLQAKLQEDRELNKPWALPLLDAVENMAKKLRTYYNKTQHPFVYSDAVILEPSGKLFLFEQDSFEPGFKEKYSNECRQRYTDNYEPSLLLPGTVAPSRKRKHNSDESSAEDNDYVRALEAGRKQRGIQNEYDRYLAAPHAHKKKDPLGWWRLHASEYPRLAKMFRDTFAVPATGAGVEREFSKGRRVASWARAQLKHTTITETMLYKNQLVREGILQWMKQF
jgi:hypothetical protein